MNYNKNELNELPDVNSILSSLVRLMSNYLRRPSASQVMTLMHLLDCLEQHPDLPSYPAAEVAVKKARVTWQELLKESRSHYMNTEWFSFSDTTLH